MDGVLVIDKPGGPTSFEVVRQVRSLLKVPKVGHTGTLDPMATGVLALCLGEATKIAGFILQADKAYRAVIQLGIETDTQDVTGKVVAEAPVPALSAPLLEAALAPFRGSFLQLPPMYSAVKVAGKRLYQSAREGESVDRTPRPVTVHELQLIDFSATELTVAVRCSKGFFVRALASDLGRALGCGATLKALRRTATGPFTLEQSLTLGALASLASEAGGGGGLEKVRQRLVSPRDALAELPELLVSPAQATRVTHGVPLEVDRPPGRIRVVGPSGRLLAIAEVGADRRLRYARVLAAGQG